MNITYMSYKYIWSISVFYNPSFINRLDLWSMTADLDSECTSEMQEVRVWFPSRNKCLIQINDIMDTKVWSENSVTRDTVADVLFQALGF